MVKPFDPADLVEKLKGKGLVIAEEGVKILEDALIEWIKESVVLTDTKLDDIAIPILEAMKPFIDAQVAKIDGK